jgi:hypothetical protein
MPSVVGLKSTVQKSLQREQGQGFRASFLKAMEPEKGMTALNIEMGRIHLVIRRTVLCLYAHETRTILPDTHESRVASLEVLSRYGANKVEEFSRMFIEPLTLQKWNRIAGNQFAYSVIHTNRPFVSVWGLMFYDILPFVGFTGPKVEF